MIVVAGVIGVTGAIGRTGAIAAPAGGFIGAIANRRGVIGKLGATVVTTGATTFGR